MTERYNVVVPRKGKDGDKTYWHNVGSAFPNKNGGYSIILDSLPPPESSDRGAVYRMQMFEAKAKEDKQHSGGGDDIEF